MWRRNLAIYRFRTLGAGNRSDTPKCESLLLVHVVVALPRENIGCLPETRITAFLRL